MVNATHPIAATERTKFLHIRSVAIRLGVPIAWLTAEAKAGRVPSITASRQLLADPEQVREALRERAALTADQPRELAHA